MAKKDRRAGGTAKVPTPTLERLATYLRLLIDREMSEVETISSAQVEQETGINAAQFRKDLSFFGEFGRPGIGYNVGVLKRRLAQILQMDTEQAVLLVGAGNLGAALVGYQGLLRHNFNIVAAYDNNVMKIGRKLWHLEIRDVDRLIEDNKAFGAKMAIITVPASEGQKVADILVKAGVKVMLNFAPVSLRVPPEVTVRDVCFIQELAVLSFHLRQEAGSQDDTQEVELSVLKSGADSL